MQLRLTLQPAQRNGSMPANYQYPLSSAIYSIIHNADESYADFLHNKGYTHNGKSFKLFTFSDLRVPFTNLGDRLLINSADAHLNVAFHIDAAATNFIKGLFMNQTFDVADIKSRVQFSVKEVQLLPDPLDAINYDEPEVILQTLSPIVTGIKNSRGNYDFKSPEDADFCRCIIHGWKEKYRAAQPNGNENEVPDVVLEVLPSRYKQRLITIKAFTPQETKIRGYSHLRLRAKAPKAILELALNAGLGLYNAQGMGCVEVVGKY